MEEDDDSLLDKLQLPDDKLRVIANYESLEKGLQYTSDILFWLLADTILTRSDTVLKTSLLKLSENTRNVLRLQSFTGPYHFNRKVDELKKRDREHTVNCHSHPIIIAEPEEQTVNCHSHPIIISEHEDQTVNCHSHPIIIAEHEEQTVNCHSHPIIFAEHEEQTDILQILTTTTMIRTSNKSKFNEGSTSSFFLRATNTKEEERNTLKTRTKTPTTTLNQQNEQNTVECTKHMHSEKVTIMRTVIQTLLHKDAIENVQNTNSPGHYFILFLSNKTSEEHQPIIDLTELN